MRKLLLYPEIINDVGRWECHFAIAHKLMVNQFIPFSYHVQRLPVVY